MRRIQQGSSLMLVFVSITVIMLGSVAVIKTMFEENLTRNMRAVEPVLNRAYTLVSNSLLSSCSTNTLTSLYGTLSTINGDPTASFKFASGQDVPFPFENDLLVFDLVTISDDTIVANCGETSGVGSDYEYRLNLNSSVGEAENYWMGKKTVP